MSISMTNNGSSGYARLHNDDHISGASPASFNNEGMTSGASSGASIFSRYGRYLADGFRYDCALGDKLIGGADSSILRKGLGSLGKVALVVAGGALRVTGVAALVSMAVNAVSSFLRWAVGKCVDLLIDVTLQKMKDRNVAKEAVDLVVDQLSAMVQEDNGGSLRSDDGRHSADDVSGLHQEPSLPSLHAGEDSPNIAALDRGEDDELFDSIDGLGRSEEASVSLLPLEQPTSLADIQGDALEPRQFDGQSSQFVDGEVVKRNIARLVLAGLQGGIGEEAVRLLDTPETRHAIDGYISENLNRQLDNPENIQALSNTITKATSETLASTEFQNQVYGSASDVGNIAYNRGRNALSNTWGNIRPYVAGATLFASGAALSVLSSYVLDDDTETLYSAQTISYGFAAVVVGFVPSLFSTATDKLSNYLASAPFPVPEFDD